jgi:hypothetical protein
LLYKARGGKDSLQRVKKINILGWGGAYGLHGNSISNCAITELKQPETMVKVLGVVVLQANFI